MKQLYLEALTVSENLAERASCIIQRHFNLAGVRRTRELSEEARLHLWDELESFVREPAAYTGRYPRRLPDGWQKRVALVSGAVQESCRNFFIKLMWQSIIRRMAGWIVEVALPIGNDIADGTSRCLYRISRRLRRT